LARPADLGKAAIVMKQGTRLGKFGLHGILSSSDDASQCSLISNE
jgi:hypothetical protein